MDETDRYVNLLSVGFISKHGAASMPDGTSKGGRCVARRMLSAVCTDQ